VWLPLLDPLVHLVAGAALLVYFCRREGLDAWHLGLDRARIDHRAGWAIAVAAAALVALAAALAASGAQDEVPAPHRAHDGARSGRGPAPGAGPDGAPPAAPSAGVVPRRYFLDSGGEIGEFVAGGVVGRAPELFAPARALQIAARYRPGGATRAVAIVFAAARAGGLAALQEVFLTGLLFAALRRRWSPLPAALVCAAAAAAIHARPGECGLDPCLGPALQAAAAHAGAALASALGYEAFRTLWLPIAIQAGFTLVRLAPGLLPAALG
jgi:hypothetical protein